MFTHLTPCLRFSKMFCRRDPKFILRQIMFSGVLYKESRLRRGPKSLPLSLDSNVPKPQRPSGESSGVLCPPLRPEVPTPPLLPLTRLVVEGIPPVDDRLGKTVNL